MKKKLIIGCFVAAVAVFAAGCSKEAPAPIAATAPEEQSKAGDHSGGAGKAKVFNSPPPEGAAATGGYRIQPANPDDPKFKADPKLAGGG